MSSRNQHQSPSQDETQKVRGRPFQPGNPGRRPGSKNKTTRLMEELLEGEAEKITRKFIDRALAGDVRCLLYAVERGLGQRRGRPIDLQLPPINGVGDIPAAMSTIAAGVTNGDLTADEAAHLVHMLDRYSNAIVASEFAIRLENLEGQVKMLNTLKHRVAQQIP